MANNRLVAGLTKPDEEGFTRIIERMKIAAKVKSGRALSMALGFNPSAVQVAKQKGLIPMAWIVAASLEFGVSADWLIYGDNQAKIDDRITVLPIQPMSLTADGQLDATNVCGGFPFYRDWLEAKTAIGNLVLLRITGDSMEPLIQNNDLALINRKDNQVVEAGLFAVAFNNAVFIKRLCMEPGKIIMRSENSKISPDIIVELSDFKLIKILGRLVWWSHDTA